MIFFLIYIILVLRVNKFMVICKYIYYIFFKFFIMIEKNIFIEFLILIVLFKEVYVKRICIYLIFDFSFIINFKEDGIFILFWF